MPGRRLPPYPASVSDTALERGRAAYDARTWGRCVAELRVADAASPLELDDLRRLSIAAFLAGDDAESEAALARGFKECCARELWQHAATCAFWMCFSLGYQGEVARS